MRDPREKQSEELKDSELDSVAGGRGGDLGHLGDTEEGAPQEEEIPGQGGHNPGDGMDELANPKEDGRE